MLPCYPQHSNLLRTFQLSSGSVPGRRHIGNGNLLAGRNNQDSFGIYQGDRFLLTSVHDGCGSSHYSEVGALMAPRLLAAAFETAIDHLDGSLPDKPQILINLAQFHFLNSLHRSIEELSPRKTGEYFNKTVLDFFLFTTIGAFLSDDLFIIFACGDGLYWLNGKLFILEPASGNTPAYIAYALLQDQDLSESFASPPALSVLAAGSLSSLQSLVLATDGAHALVRNEISLVPGKQKTVGPIEQLWLDDRFYDDQQPELLTLWLRQLNSEVTRLSSANTCPATLKRHCGLLEDDTTLVTLRRRAHDHD
ncbi:MAG: protein phosphatase 2C domain-containing protein [Candidatus Obscuribacterales bacterium]|nr:protein phosphatase 2C domain-containing protein [Candidatus Obscuribacterales bacterium]